tara:strand:- start:949 stop:2163 length:1215 start_codon:yes stop_codon:yes gene_type:complete
MVKFDWDKFNQAEKNLEELFIPKYFPGYTLSVYQNGIESYYSQKGYDDIFNKIEYSRDSIFRIYSMTKPIVSTAIMQLIENNQISLDDNVDLYIPEWKNLKYFNGSKIETLKRQVNIKDLLTHTSGLTYGFQGQSDVDRKYKEKNINNIVDTTLKTQEIINELSGIPLEFSPGDFYNYSISIDVLGFIIERVSNYSLQEYLDINVFEKLDMKDTSFTLDKSKKDRMAKCYRWNEKNNIYELHNKRQDPNITVKSYLENPNSFSGGAGLLSTMKDYQLFGSAILGAKKGRDNPLLKKSTAELMMQNHLPRNKYISDLSMYPIKGEQYYKGIGYGLGGSICCDENLGISNSEKGDFGWGGAASTSFYISNKYDYSFVFLTQVLESEETKKLNSIVKKLINDCVINV